SLGYQHRGAERTLPGGPCKRTIHVLETVAGDTTVGHATAYCQAVEALAGCRVPLRAEMLRGVGLELERLANHTGDLGALTGDVFARAYVRGLEIPRSVAFIRSQLQAFADGPIRAEAGPLQPEQLVVSLVEGWRGEICHVALTDAQGRFSRYKIVDPSFHNWTALAMALRDQQISDFPLCNKSFNLSYCGHDL